MWTSHSTSLRSNASPDPSVIAESAFERAKSRCQKLSPEETAEFVVVGIWAIHEGNRTFSSWLQVVRNTKNLPPDEPSDFQLRLAYEQTWNIYDDPDELRPPDPNDYGISWGYLERAIEGAEAWKSRAKSPSKSHSRVLRLLGLAIAASVFIVGFSAVWPRWAIAGSIIAALVAGEYVIVWISTSQDRKQRARFDWFNPDPIAYQNYSQAYADYETAVADVHVSQNGIIHYSSYSCNMLTSWKMPRFQAELKRYSPCGRCGKFSARPKALPVPFGPTPLPVPPKKQTANFRLGEWLETIVTLAWIGSYIGMLFGVGSRQGSQPSNYRSYSYGHFGGSRTTYTEKNDFNSSDRSGLGPTLGSGLDGPATGSGASPRQTVPPITYKAIPNVYRIVPITQAPNQTQQSTKPQRPASVAGTNPNHKAKSIWSPDFTGRTFTLGSDEDTVRRVQGTPSSLAGSMWWYENSYVMLEDGIVVGWSNNSQNLKVHITSTATPKKISITLGSSPNDVVAVLGTPTSINRTMWWYENSDVTCKDAIVVGWADNSHILKVNLVPAIGVAVKSFSIGSSPDEVVSAQGTPTSINGTMWWYENSYLQFEGNRVRSYSDNSGILHIH